jgi:hypothetical protein
MVSTASCMVGYKPPYRQREKNAKGNAMRTKLTSLILAVAVTVSTIPAAFALTSSQVGQRGDAVPLPRQVLIFNQRNQNQFLQQILKPCPNRAIPNRVTTCIR